MERKTKEKKLCDVVDVIKNPFLSMLDIILSCDKVHGRIKDKRSLGQKIISHKNVIKFSKKFRRLFPKMDISLKKVFALYV